MSEPTKPCDGTKCQCESQCRQFASNGYMCSLPKGHIGPHAACGAVEHNLATWPQEVPNAILVDDSHLGLPDKIPAGLVAELEAIAKNIKNTPPEAQVVIAKHFWELVDAPTPPPAAWVEAAVKEIAEFSVKWNTIGEGKNIHGSFGENIAAILTRHAPSLAAKEITDAEFWQGEAETGYRVIATKDAEISRLNAEVATLRQANSAANSLIGAQAQENDKIVAKLQSELSKAKAVVQAANNLASYAPSVRTDSTRRRVIEGEEYALQTLDWCKGLIEYAEATDKALTAFEGEKP